MSASASAQPLVDSPSHPNVVAVGERRTWPSHFHLSLEEREVGGLKSRGSSTDPVRRASTWQVGLSYTNAVEARGARAGGPAGRGSRRRLGFGLLGVASSPLQAPTPIVTPQLLTTLFRPELRQGYPLNLSISISGGRETNQDSPSNGERTGKSPK